VRYTKKKILPFLFLSGLFASSLSQAAQLGKLEILSGSGQPFQAQIQIDLVLPEERSSLQAKLASLDAFQAARLTMDPNLKSLRFEIQEGKQSGTALVKITSMQPLPAGFIDALVELTWSGGRVAREYTLSIPADTTNSSESVAKLQEISPPLISSAINPSIEMKDGNKFEAAFQVQRGDTLSELALDLAGDGVSLNQAMAAIYEMNKGAFIRGSVHLIKEGVVIQIPSRVALRSRSNNQALLILAQNDDRNIYSAYVSQIGFLTVENQNTSSALTTFQGNVTSKDKASPSTAITTDRFQISAESTPSLTNNSDANAEELLAKNKALAEANERIALLEKNVSDLQRLLDMQNDVSADNPANQIPTESIEEENLDAESSVTDISIDTVKTESAKTTDLVNEISVVEPVKNDSFSNWMAWILAGAGGLVVLVVFLLVSKLRRSKDKDAQDDELQENESMFSEVNEFDQTIISSISPKIDEKASSLNQSENSTFDLSDVLTDQSDVSDQKAVLEPKKEIEPVVEEFPKMESGLEEKNATQEADPLSSEVKLDFPEDDIYVDKDNSILDDLDSLEKGALAAQEELDVIRKQTASENLKTEEDSVDAETEVASIDKLNPENELDSKVELDVDVPNPKIDEATWQEVATKLDLAAAYVEIGDADGAKELLNEIVKKGDVDQVRKAKALLALTG
jgi:pilus assembly protein FimV